ncbi:hypothetical protein [Flavobacterium sp.]|jgi:hypothetical protein|uniref:hypothetical protein n=1 Tax=Flavobacterium sp. TaxID=239 RepID=UPI002A7FEACA|nr:hypothetical protein [Flavobacterium sp.]
MHINKIIILLLLSFTVFSQSEIKGKVTLTDSISDYSFIYVLLRTNDTIYTGSQLDKLGDYKLAKKVPNGKYEIVVKHLTYKDLILKNIIVDDKDLVMDINFPGPCEYNEKTPQKCVNDHTDNIIPIVYGYPNKRLMKRAKKGKVHIGGCIVSQCDSYFYCKIHNKEL